MYIYVYIYIERETLIWAVLQSFCRIHKEWARHGLESILVERTPPKIRLKQLTFVKGPCTNIVKTLALKGFLYPYFGDIYVCTAQILGPFEKPHPHCALAHVCTST